MTRALGAAPFAAVVAMALALGGCGHNPLGYGATLSERECLARVMYFESNRSSEEGMLAVGTVVMNRLQSPRYPKTICGVVGQQNQFAEGALSKPAGGHSLQRALRVADAVLAGQRHPGVGGAMFFHTAGYTFPYRNMAYVVAAGGNVFYEKRTPGTFEPIPPAVLVAQAERARLQRTVPVQVASAADEDEAPAVQPVARRATPPRPAARDEDAAPPPRRTRLASAALDEDGDEVLERALAEPRRPEPPAREAPRARPRALPEYSEEPVRRARSVASADREAETWPHAVPPPRPDRPRTPGPAPLSLAALREPERVHRDKGPPSIADLIELDMERPRKAR